MGYFTPLFSRFAPLFSLFAPGSVFVRKLKGFHSLFFRGINKTWNLHEIRKMFSECFVSRGVSWKTLAKCEMRKVYSRPNNYYMKAKAILIQKVIVLRLVIQLSWNLVCNVRRDNITTSYSFEKITPVVSIFEAWSQNSWDTRCNKLLIRIPLSFPIHKSTTFHDQTKKYATRHAVQNWGTYINTMVVDLVGIVI